MAGNSISSQLQAIKLALNVTNEPEPGRKRPFSRPSILFDAKAAADIDVDTIFNLAISGLDVLISSEERFKNYKNDLFSQQSKELDRELLGLDENKRINASISSYLRLLSGYLELCSALKTLEYLIRRYKVHVFNKDDLILCALPFHDTHVFVQIVQLIDTGNSRWSFLDGVKSSGSRLPREIIVQQCLRDMGVLEAICDYATPVKNVQPSKEVIGFCTGVVFEVLGIANVSSDMVKKILPYLNSVLQSGSKELNQKAGAVMIISLLAQKTSLSPSVAKSLLHWLADIARAGTREESDLQFIRMSIMSLITVVQLQNLDLIPKKTMDVLNEVRDFPGILADLDKKFNIDKFLGVLVYSLVEYSSFDAVHGRTLLSLLEIVTLKFFVKKIVVRLLSLQLKLSQGKINSTSGNVAKQILRCLLQKYPNESRRAFLSVSKDTNKSSYDVLCTILDEHFHSSDEVVDPKLFFALEHSEPETRRFAVSSISTLNISSAKTDGLKKLSDIQDALVRRLYDEELSVVLAVLSLSNLPDIINAPLLIESIQHVLHKCTGILLTSSSNNKSLHDVAFACLQQVVRNFKDEDGYVLTIAAAILPLLLIRPKTQLNNMKALELSKELSWPFYENLALPTVGKELKECISSTNFDNISKLGKSFSSRWEEYMPWLVDCCKSHDLSKTLFFLVLFQSLSVLKKDADQFLLFFGSCFPFIKNEWEVLEAAGISAELSEKRILDRDCRGILEDLNFKMKDLNSEILACLLLRLIEAFTETMPRDESLDLKGIWASCLKDIFLFFTSHSKSIFEKHLDLLLLKCKASLTGLMLNMLTEEGVSDASQIESLHFLTRISSQLDESHARQILLDFPVVLVSLSSENKSVRAAAMTYIEALSALCSCISRNGKFGARLQCLGEVTSLVIQQKKMILSDTNFLSSLLTSVLSSSSESLLVQHDIEKRFDNITKDEMLHFILDCALGLPAHSKLRILSLIKGVGSKLMSIPVMSSLLHNLLESCSLHCSKLSQSEIDILCLLLESCSNPSSSHELRGFEEFILKALGLSSTADSAVLEPCLCVLRNLNSSLFAAMKNETQEIIFCNLLELFRSTRGDVQSSARDALLRIDFGSSIIGRVVDLFLDQKTGLTYEKRQKKSVRHSVLVTMQNKKNTLTMLSSLLDVLLMKKNMKNRTSLFGPLFKLLCMIMTSDAWMPKATDNDETHMSSNSPRAMSVTAAYIQQALLLVLENITASIDVDPVPKDMLQSFDLQLVLSCARTSNDIGVQNHIFSLITTSMKIMPDVISGQMLDILAAVGEYAIAQWDSNSQRVFEGLISAIVPCWLSRNDDTDQLLQIFVGMFAYVAEHRRVFITVHVLRILGEADCLGSLLFFLFHSMISKLDLFSDLSGDQQHIMHITLLAKKQWEYEFVVQLCGNYSCSIWLRSIIILLKKIGNYILNEDSFMQMFVAMLFIADKLQDPESSYKLQSEEDLNDIQFMIGELMEQVVCHQQLVESAKKRIVPAIIKSELKTFTRCVLKTLMKSLPYSTYLEVIIKLIGNGNRDVRNKALHLFCETMKDLGTDKKFENKRSLSRSRTSWLHPDENCLGLVEKLCLETLILFESPDEVSSTSTKLATLSLLEVLAERFPSQDRVLSICLGSVCKRIYSDNAAISSHCLLTAASLINALGLGALPELPNVMHCVLKKLSGSDSVTSKSKRMTTDSTFSNSGEHVFASILQILASITDKLSGFLNPYLGDILNVVVLHPLSSSLDPKLKVKADTLRERITERIPARLLLPPLLSMYTDAVTSGENSVSILFVMLGKSVGFMDRSSISAYHAKVFDSCLLALDLRTQKHDSIQNIDQVEQNIINTFVTLTMKLTETMFRPLFVRTVEWSTSIMNSSENTSGEAISRAICFYNLVNKLAEDHRSLFVPYFKYLTDGCVKGLVGTEDSESGVSLKKRKKAKKNPNSSGVELSPLAWRLRALILKALHKCFLYDTGSPKFLDSSQFQVLLQPIVSQLVVEPPDGIENFPNLPSVKDVDDLLVSCVGQMAIAADSDLLWKPLNHEVLMQTRSEKLRARVLGLRIVKNLVENLRESYMTLLPESIPFLGELLEDDELSVKTLAQEILIEMETISGESLKEYL